MGNSIVVVMVAVAMMFMLTACSQSPTPSNESATNTQPADAQAADAKPPEAQTVVAKPQAALLDFTMDSLQGTPVNLSEYAGKVVLFVNVASKCGYTKQYPALEELYKKYKDQGLVLVGVPANDFGGQEPGTNEQIAQFCTANYGVTFPMLAKVHVKGDEQCPLYQALVAASSANGLSETGPVKWNFEKFLVDRQGNLVARFRSPVTPMSAELTGAVEKALAG